jgi:hypothetical protein
MIERRQHVVLPLLHPVRLRVLLEVPQLPRQTGVYRSLETAVIAYFLFFYGDRLALQPVAALLRFDLSQQL